MKTLFSTGTILSSTFLNQINGRELKFIHPAGTPLNSMLDGEYYQLDLSNFDVNSLDSRYVTLTTPQAVAGDKTFTGLLRSNTSPTTSNDVVNLGYLTNYVDLVSTQSITGSKTFNGVLKLSTSPTTSNDVVNLGYLTNYVDLVSTQSITGSKTFNGVLKLSTSPTASNDVVNLGYLTSPITGYVDLVSTQSITGNKTFNGVLKTNTTPVSNNDVVNLGYIANPTTGYVNLDGTQTITGSKTFLYGVVVREPQAGNEAINLRDSHNRFQSTAQVLIRINNTTLTQSYTHEYLDLFNDCTIYYNKPAQMAGLILEPYGNLGAFTVENRYGEAMGDPTLLVKYGASLVGGSGYVYTNYSRHTGLAFTTPSADTVAWAELDNDNSLRKQLDGNFRTTLCGNIDLYGSTESRIRVISLVQMLESPANVFNPRTGQISFTGIREIILSF